MTAAIWLRNIAAFAAQAAVLVAAGFAIWRLTRVRHGAVSHAFWRVLLLVCLLLPIAQPWHAAALPKLTLTMATGAEAAPAGPESRDVQTVPVAPPRTAVPSTSEWLLLVLAGGIAARGLWLVLGAFSLRRLRRTATLLDPPPPAVQSACARVGVRADVAVSPRVAGPITFGYRRPLVIVPPRVLAMDDALQEAIVCHELMHVRRNDWLTVIGEELVRTIFWFHPVLWWLINRIQLSREHVVDEAVVALTKSRERYVEAMLAVALSRSPLAFAPAPQFLRRRSLKRRVAHILQETTMTTRRLITSIAAAAGVLIATSVLVVREFPLEARAPQAATSQVLDARAPVAIARGGEHLLHGSLPEYPRRALDQRVEGEVSLEITVDDQGEVSDARVISGPDELRRAALESVLQWHYLPGKISNTTLPVALRFNASAVQETRRKIAKGEPVEISLLREGENYKRYAIEYRPGERLERTPTEEVEGELSKLQHALAESGGDAGRRAELTKLYEIAKSRLEAERAERARKGEQTRSELPQRLAGVKVERVSNEIVKDVLDRAGVSVGTMIGSKTTLTQIREALEALDPHLRVRFEHDGKGGLILVVIAP